MKDRRVLLGFIFICIGIVFFYRRRELYIYPQVRRGRFFSL